MNLKPHDDEQNTFCPHSLKLALNSLVKDNTNDRQTHYLYDIVDNQRFIINNMGLIIENIFDDSGNIIHSISYAKALDLEAHSALRKGDNAFKQYLLANGAQDLRQYISNLDNYIDNLDNLHKFFIFNANGKPIYMVDEKGLVTQYLYNKSKIKTHTIYYKKYFDLKSYSLAEIEQELTDNYHTPTTEQGDRVFVDVFDKAGRLTGEIDPANNIDLYKLDPGGCRIEHTDRAGFKTNNEFDGAKRHVAEILPESLVSQVLLNEGDNKTSKPLNLVCNKRRIRNEKKYNAVSALTSVLHDCAGDGDNAKEVKFINDLDNNQVGTQITNIEVDDPTKHATSLTENRPTIKVDIETKKVLSTTGKTLVETNEAGFAHFKIYDALDHLIFEIKPDGLIIEYINNKFGQTLEQTKFADNLSQSQLVQYLDTGINVVTLQKLISEFKGNQNNRKLIYDYNPQGKLDKITEGKMHYFDPRTGDFYQG